ncbi:MAG: T9SS type A sorting domain-containing protein [Prevotellaceae bacterium]|jgi:1,4-alpha-glucan branching enzyme|nr:T9SS type A sorting domain-containing protein [Prevotellaceae bacterium]
MKKNFTFFLTLLLPYLLAAQVVTTNPAFIPSNYSGAVEVIFDAAQGNQGLKDFTGDVYAHTGVITSASTSGSDWKHAPTWLNNAAKYKLTSLGNNKWQLNITPSISAYYGVNAGETVEKLAFVFRNASGSQQGKDVGGTDIFVELINGLSVQLNTSPSNQLLNINTNVTFNAAVSETAALELKINGDTKQTANGTTLTYSQTFTATGDYQCIIFATANAQTVSDTVNLCVLANAPTGTLPAGAQVGINYISPTSATLVLYAKDKSNALPDNVFVIGDFNNWTYSNNYQMKKDGTSGNWWLTLEDLVPQQEYAYQYAVKIGNNIVKISDAYAEKVLDPSNDSYLGNIYPNLKPYPTGKTEGLAAVLQTDKPEFTWSAETQNFVEPNKDNLVIYELWVYDFSAQRTINEVTERLDYLETLGVNAIELMPIQEFDGNISWGYNPNHFFAPDKAYGTETDYKTFIDECHKRGIAVILDVVFNHATGQHPFAKLYWNSAANKTAANNPWFNVDAPHPYSVFHDFNHAFDGTRNHINRVLQYWLNEYKIDGYRLDLTKGFTNNTSNDNTAGNYDATRVAFLKGYYDAAKAAKNDVIFILEHFCADSEENELANYGMLLWRNRNNAFSQTAMGYMTDSDFGGANVKKRVSFAESHDEERNFYKAKTYGNGLVKTDETARLSRIPANLAFISLLQGSKMLWQFEELGFDYSIDANGGRTNPKPLPENLGWFQNELRMNGYDKAAKAIALRTKLRPEIFINGSVSATIGTNVKVRNILWEYNGTKILAVANFDIAANTYTMPAGSWYDYLNGNAAQNGGATLTLQQGELRIFTTDNTIVAPDVPDDFPYLDVNEILESKCVVFPTVTNSDIFIVAQDNIKQIDVFSLRGEKLLSFGSQTSINIANLPSGMYLMIVTFDKKQEAFKIIRK